MMNASTFQEAPRLLTSILASREKRCLVWLAERMPSRVNSDHLTLLALVSMALAGLSYWLASFTRAGLVAAIACLALNWFGDSLDGTLARVRHAERPRYGFYVDHVLDAVGTLFLVAGLGASGYMSPLVALGLLVAYYLLSIEVYLATHTLCAFRISFWGVGPTELRILLAIGNLVLLIHPTVDIAGHPYRLFDVGGMVGIAGLLATFLVSAARNTCALYRAEPLNRRR